MGGAHERVGGADDRVGGTDDRVGGAGEKVGRVADRVIVVNDGSKALFSCLPRGVYVHVPILHWK